MKSVKTKVWIEKIPILLEEKPTLTPFSFNYLAENGPIYTDINSYRPDPVRMLDVDKTYDAVLFFEPEMDCDGCDIEILRRIEIPSLSKKFARIR